MKAIQHFTPEYLEACKKMTPMQIAEFLEEFRLMFGGKKELSKEYIESFIQDPSFEKDIEKK